MKRRYGGERRGTDFVIDGEKRRRFGDVFARRDVELEAVARDVAEGVGGKAGIDHASCKPRDADLAAHGEGRRDYADPPHPGGRQECRCTEHSRQPLMAPANGAEFTREQLKVITPVAGRTVR